MNLKKKLSYKRNSKKLFIILPQWGGKFHHNFFLRKKLLKNNFSVLELEFPESILSSNWKSTLDSFLFIKESTIEEIRKLKEKYEFEEIKIIGISLGCVNACMVASNNSDISEILLIVPGHCLAESMWEGKVTQEIRRSYKNKGISLKELKKHWYTLAPENNLKAFESKKISILLSKKDKAIPFYCGKKLVKKIKSLNQSVTYKENQHFGHKMTALSFLLRPHKYL